jgi:hypothetical protein
VLPSEGKVWQELLSVTGLPRPDVAAHRKRLPLDQPFLSPCSAKELVLVHSLPHPLVKHPRRDLQAEATDPCQDEGYSFLRQLVHRPISLAFTNGHISNSDLNVES